MKLREVSIKNFRCLRDVTVPICDNMVLVGENNTGKTAFLEALKIVIPHSTIGRQEPFDEYDYYMCKQGDCPEKSDGIVIEVWFREDNPDEWPASIVQALNEIVQTDPIKDIDSIGLRLSSKYDDATKDFITKWEFLDLKSQPLGGKGATASNLNKFLGYIRLFYLSALRDSENEFSPRSQYWGRILRELKISEEQRISLEEELTKLNKELLGADPKLEQVRSSLDNVSHIIALGDGNKTSIQALPLKPWDLMSKSRVVMQTNGNEVDFPLSRHGQGIQSLAILFLFQVYIDVALKPMFHPETEAILTLEEPEAHLHPQAIRTLAKSLCELKGQKIISCHSPYFIQEIPFRQIRMFKKQGPLTKILYIKPYYSVELPQSEKLTEFCAANRDKYSFHLGTSTLRVKGIVEEDEYRKLLQACATDRDTQVKLKRFKDESLSFINEDELQIFDTYVKRVRGEILFARAWLLCEGQSDYLIYRYFAELLKSPLDIGGVSVIDFQNNGSPGAFVSLARVFEIPWIMTCDNDNGGRNAIHELKNKGITADELNSNVFILPDTGMALEKYLVKNGFLNEYLEILTNNAKTLQPNNREWLIAEQRLDGNNKVRQIYLKEDNELELRITENRGTPQIVAKSYETYDLLFSETLSAQLEKDKIGSANSLISLLRKKKASADRVPNLMRDIINTIIARAS